MIDKSITDRLGSMSKKDLLELKKRIDFFIQMTAGENDEPKAGDRDWITDGIWAELAKRGILENMFRPQVVKRSAPKDYSAKCEAVRVHLLRFCGKLSDAQQSALGR